MAKEARYSRQRRRAGPQQAHSPLLLAERQGRAGRAHSRRPSRSHQRPQHRGAPRRAPLCNLPVNASKQPAQFVIELATGRSISLPCRPFIRVCAVKAGSTTEDGPARRVLASSHQFTGPTPPMRFGAVTSPGCPPMWPGTFSSSTSSSTYSAARSSPSMSGPKRTPSTPKPYSSESPLPRASLVSTTLSSFTGTTEAPKRRTQCKSPRRPSAFPLRSFCLRVRNDNPHAKALLRTANNHNSLPAHGFDDINKARRLDAYFLDANNNLLSAEKKCTRTSAPTVPNGGCDTLSTTGHPLLSPI